VDDYAYKDEATLRVAAETAKTTVHELGHQFLLGDYLGGHPPHLAWNNSDGCVMIYGAPLLPDGRDPNYSGAHGSGSGEFGAWDVAQIRGMSGAGGDWENGL
jgi:hypothetical protein